MRPLCLVFLVFFGSAFARAKPQVVTTHTVLADLVNVIAGDRVEAKCLLPINLDPHSYEPKPADIRLLARADLVVLNGLGLETWAEKSITQSGFKGIKVVAGEGIPRLLIMRHDEKPDGDTHPPEHYDPHAWHNPKNVRRYVEAICDGLIQISPANAEVFRANAAAYSEKLDELDRYARAQISSVPPERRKFVSSHDSLAYFADAYGLTIEPVSGTRPDQEPSAHQLAQLIEFIRKQRVKAAFFEATASSKLIDVVARETGVTVVKQLYTDSLGPAGSPGATYLGMFRFNVDTIVKALK